MRKGDGAPPRCKQRGSRACCNLWRQQRRKHCCSCSLRCLRVRSGSWERLYETHLDYKRFTCSGIDVLLHDVVGENTEWLSAVPCSCVMDLPDRDAPYQQSRPQSCPQDQDERRKWSSCDRKPEGDIQKKIRR